MALSVPSAAWPTDSSATLPNTAHTTHFHAHSNRGEPRPHDARRHQHAHRALTLRALLVGMVHGLAGSAALVLLTLQHVRSPRMGLLYVLLFGIGSMLGMAALSWTISIPMRLSAHRLSRVHHWLNGRGGAFQRQAGIERGGRAKVRLGLLTLLSARRTRAPRGRSAGEPGR
ncbi:MAG: hypothetical protein ABIO45_14300 [Burkholderiaceae bacterium]